MSVIVPQLSSPCGYYGEHVLQQFMSPLVSTVCARESLGGAHRNATSHFSGIRLFEDGSSWFLEALVPGAEIFREGGLWVPFAKPLLRDGARRVDNRSISYVPHEPTPGSRSLTPQEIEEYRKCEHEAEEPVREAARKLRAPLVRLNGSLLPQRSTMHELRMPWDVASPLCDWIGSQQESLLRLKHADVDEMLKDLASCFSSAFTARLGTGHGELAEFTKANSQVLFFLSRLLRLHWYLGHDDWAGVLSSLDGGFPQTEPPSPAWTVVLHGGHGPRVLQNPGSGRGFTLD